MYSSINKEKGQSGLMPLTGEMSSEGGSERRKPVWGFFDRPATIATLHRFGDLAACERMELFGAATAAIWLGADLGSDLSSSTPARTPSRVVGSTAAPGRR
jgi:hypothetical protein